MSHHDRVANALLEHRRRARPPSADIYDLSDTACLEEYVGSSTSILIFLSRGYFNSKACLRESCAAVKLAKPLIIVHEADEQYGGVTLELLQNDCPAELRSALFQTADEIIPWLRLPPFQDQVIVLIAERILKASLGLSRPPGLASQAEVAANHHLFMPGSLAASEYQVGKVSIYVSRHNKGALEVAARLISYFKKGSAANTTEAVPAELSTAQQVLSSNSFEVKGLIASQGSQKNVGAPKGRTLTNSVSGRFFGGPIRGKVMLLYLSADVFLDADGNLNEALCSELQIAMDVGFRVILLHPVTSVAFDRIIDTCPRDLLVSGLLRCIAVQLQPEPFERVSANILAKTMQGKPSRKSWWEMDMNVTHKSSSLLSSISRRISGVRRESSLRLHDQDRQGQGGVVLQDNSA